MHHHALLRPPSAGDLPYRGPPACTTRPCSVLLLREIPPIEGRRAASSRLCKNAKIWLHPAVEQSPPLDISIDIATPPYWSTGIDAIANPPLHGCTG
jgi:hypothetical protein